MKTYAAPKLTVLGDIRAITLSGTPNVSFDGGSIRDFFGPAS